MKQLTLLCCCTFILGYALHAQVSSSFMFEGVDRNYLTYVPATLPQGSPAPVVLVLHGFTQTAQGIMNYSGFNAIAETAGFIAVYPNGINLSWNVGFSSTGANDVGFLNALIDTLNIKYPVDLDRVYACGMSNGGFMSYRLACELSDRIAAIASVTGSMTTQTFNDCHPERPVPVMEIHGTSDLIVNYNGATGIKSIPDVIEYWVGQNGCPEFPEITLLPDVINEGSRVERSIYRPCAQYSEVVLLKVVDGGHTWPGSTNSGFGNTNRDINASQEIWNFFNRFSLSGSPNASGEADKLHDVRAFPNPASETLFVTLPQESVLQNATLRLFDSQGRVVLQQAVPDSVVELYVGDLPSGVYMVEVWTEAGIAMKRVVVQ
ncbi:MAG: T9SS type A sorting domain-containing protein [Saprospiraceae bacterium]